MDNKNIFSENLKKYMDLNNKTRIDVAEALGISYFTVTSWVNGTKYPRMDKVEMLANYFGILKSDLIEDKSDLIEDKDKPTEDDGLSANQKALMDFAKSVPEEKAGMILRVMRSILEDS